MRILCLSYEYPPVGGGGSPICKGLAESLVALGHEVDVVTSAMPDLPQRDTVGGVRIYRVRCVRRRRHMANTFELGTTLLPSYRQALQLWRQRRHDLIHCHFILPSGVVARWLGRVTGVPYVLTAHGSDVPGYNPDRFHLAHRLVRPMWRRIVRQAKAITAPSRFLASLIQKQLDVPIHIIPNGMTIPPPSNGPRCNRILLASRLFERKGVQDFLRAMQGVDTQGWQIVVAGDGPYRPALERLAAELDVPAQFLNFVPRDQLAQLYRSSKIFVFPSHRENFPVVLLEAMAAGCAVVACSAAGSGEVIGQSTIRVDAGDIQTMRQALVQLMGDDRQIARLGQQAYERVQRFAWPKVADQFDNLFRRCVNGRLSEEACAPAEDEQRAVPL